MKHCLTDKQLFRSAKRSAFSVATSTLAPFSNIGLVKMSERKRLVYSIEQLRRLRPPPPSPPSQPSPVEHHRSAPLSIPRRPSPSPTRSPPNARSRAHSLSSSPPTGPFLSPSSYDPSNMNVVVNIHSSNRNPSPMLPPGFGPPRTISTSKSSNSNSTIQARIGERRIARGPNLSNNFASRIAFAASRKQRKHQKPPHVNPHAKSHSTTSSNQSKPNVTQRPHQTPPGQEVHQNHQQILRRNYELSSEIDRLFADDTPVQTSHTHLDARNHHSLSNSRSCGHGLTRQRVTETEFNAGQGPSSLEDAAATLASVANCPPSVADSNATAQLLTDEVNQQVELEQPQPIADITFEDFAKQLAAGAQSRVVERETEGADVGVPVGHQSEVQVQATRLDNVEVSTVETEVARTEVQAGAEGNDPSVAALAKWFSSLAAAADVVEGVVNEEVDMKGAEAVETGAEEVIEEGQIDESVANYMSAVWKRAVDGRMMEWAQENFEDDNHVEIVVKVDDLMETGNGFEGGVSVVNGPVATSALDSMMTLMAKDEVAHSK